MATLREIRRRIVGVRSTQKITKAMKMVAAAKLRRAQDSIVSARPYATKIKELMQKLAATETDFQNPFIIQKSNTGNIAIVVVTADRGLCGAFNTNILRTAINYIKNFENDPQPKNIYILSVGKRGYDFFLKHKYKIDYKYIGIFHSMSFENARKITNDITKAFLNGKYDQVYVIYNEFKSVVQQRVVVEQLLPIPPATFSKDDEKKKNGLNNYLFEPDMKKIINSLIPRHLNFQVWRILLESNAAEQGARMTAMENATTNADELIRDLQLIYNKARQASITKELLEIVGGAEALK